MVSQWLGLSPPTLVGYYTIRGVATYPEGHKFGPVFQQIVGEGVRAGIAPIDPTRVYWFISNGKRSEGDFFYHFVSLILPRVSHILSYPNLFSLRVRA